MFLRFELGFFKNRMSSFSLSPELVAEIDSDDLSMFLSWIDSSLSFLLSALSFSISESSV